jgi:menaquinone-dependent protoporphyrinogen oxidase
MDLTPLCRSLPGWNVRGVGAGCVTLTGDSKLESPRRVMPCWVRRYIVTIKGGLAVNVLVAYASRYGSTKAIAEFMASRLTDDGVPAAAVSVEEQPDLAQFDAFVVGSAVYMGHWLKPALRFVRDGSEVLAKKPTWLFSSGPLGPASTKAHEETGAGSADPAELGEMRDAIQPRAHEVFDGALSPGRLSIGHRAIRLLPAGRALLPDGDFRQWPGIEAWVDDIARELKHSAAQRTTAH